MSFHGITHHSPSSLNLAAAALPLYFMEKILGKRSPGSCAMYRGIAAETGIVHGLVHHDVNLHECQNLALLKYDELSSLSSDPKRAKERDAIPGLIEQGLIALRPYGVPDEVQLKVYYDIPGLALPVLGYCDLGWTTHGIRLDIKTQLALAAEPSDPHRRQVACYVHDTNLQPRLAYLTPKRHGVYLVEDAKDDMAALIQIAKRVEKFLCMSADPAELTAILIPDYSSYYFHNPITRAIGREVFGF